MEDYISIFVESNEKIGILYDGYKNLLPKTEAFLSCINDFIDKLNENPEDISSSLSDDITTFRKAALAKIDPKPIELNKIKSLTKQIKEFQTRCEDLLKKYIKAKDKLAYGGNYFRSVIKKPKVYVKDPNPETYSKVNQHIREANRGMDWVEKVIMDLYNMADQDLNIIEIIDRVYKKQHIFESKDYAVIEDVADNVLGMLPESMLPYNSNTTDKKTGGVAPYIKNAHDMATFGEEEPEKELDIDDYKRPGAEKEPEKEDIQKTPDEETPGSEPYKDPEVAPVKKLTSEEDLDKPMNGGSGTNYYYYTYNNSLNRNQDDHSVHTDDHSVNNISGSYNNNSDKEDKQFRGVESTNPWELNLGIDELILEAGPVTTDGKSEYDKVKELLKRAPKPSDLKYPDKITLIFDAGKKDGNKDDFIRNTVDVRIGRVYDDAGQIVKVHPEKEIPLSIYYLNGILDQHNEINCKYTIDLQKPLKDLIRSACEEQDKEYSDNILDDIRKYNVVAKYCYLKRNGQIGFTFDTDLDPEHGFGVNVDAPTLGTTHGDDSVGFESTIRESVNIEEGAALDAAVAELDAKVLSNANVSAETLFDTMRKTAAIVSKNDPDVMKDIEAIIDDPKKFFNDNTDGDDNFRDTYQSFGSVEDYGFHWMLSYPQLVLMDKRFTMYPFDHHCDVEEFVSDIKTVIKTLGYDINFDFDSLSNDQRPYDWFTLIDKEVKAYKLIETDVIGDFWQLSFIPSSDEAEYTKMHSILSDAFGDSAMKNTDKILKDYYSKKFGEEYVESSMIGESKSPEKDTIKRVFKKIKNNLKSYYKEMRSKLKDTAKDEKKNPVNANFKSYWRLYTYPSIGNPRESFMMMSKRNIKKALTNDSGIYLWTQIIVESPYALDQLEHAAAVDSALNIIGNVFKKDSTTHTDGKEETSNAFVKSMEPRIDSVRDLIGKNEKDSFGIVFSNTTHVWHMDFKNKIDSKIVLEGVDPEELKIFIGSSDSVMMEEVGDADDGRPKSDHPIKDILLDVDRTTAKAQQKAKKAAQDVINVGKAAMKPINRTKSWINGMISKFKDANETNIKEKMADPYARKGLFNAIRKAVTAGALLKAGILLNPVFLFLAVSLKVSNNSKEFRIRNEMITELKNEMDIVQMKIDSATNHSDKAKLMRFKNELNKKLLRVGGGKKWAKII